MNFDNAILPTEDQVKALMESDVSGPIVMLNLLKFRAKAEYADGRETDLTGIEAYGLYGQQVGEVVAAAGGKPVVSSVARNLMIGQVSDLWDMVILVEFPSKEAFLGMGASPGMAEAGVHRAAGLQGQLLIQTSPI